MNAFLSKSLDTKYSIKRYPLGGQKCNAWNKVRGLLGVADLEIPGLSVIEVLNDRSSSNKSANWN